MIHNLWNIVSTTYAGAAGMSLQIYTYKQFYFDELLEVHVFTLAELKAVVYLREYESNT
jgi:hypothetical protein